MCKQTRIRVMLLMAAAGMLFALARGMPAQGKASSEYEVKAAFLLNFAQFIEWPQGTFASNDSPIVVGVLGTDPFGEVLEATFADALAQGRRLVVRRGRNVDDLRDCNMLFVSQSESDRQSEILASVRDSSMVTVSETKDFARRGGIINFYFEGNKVRFEINPGAAERKGLKLSSQLLKRARIVD
jgi:hypothetical protein